MERAGMVIRARREALGMSQGQLAWLAGVSRTTIRNIEADRVAEARTWDQVEKALGWQPGSLEMIKSGDHPVEILTRDVLRLIIKAMLRRLDVLTEMRNSMDAASEFMHRARTDLSVAQRISEVADLRPDPSDETLQARIAETGKSLKEAQARFRVHESDLDAFRGAYTTALSILSPHEEVSPNQKRGRLKLLLEHARRDLAHSEVVSLIHAMEPALGLEPPLESTDRTEEGGDSMLLPPLDMQNHEHQQESRKAAVRPSPSHRRGPDGVESDRLIVFTVPVPRKNFKELEQGDFAWVTEKLTEMAVAFTGVIAESRRRERARGGFEIQAEFPAMGVNDADIE